MDSIWGTLKKFSFATNYSRWSPTFSKMVSKVSVSHAANTLSIGERVQLLRKLENYLKVPKFTNTDETEILQAMEDMLRLWKYLLEFIVVCPKVSLKEIGYTSIVQLIQRDEFALKTIGFDAGSSVTKVSPKLVHMIERYKALLLETYLFVVNAMSARGKFAEIIHFSAQTLSIFFFRLPLVGGRIIDALASKVNSQENGIQNDDIQKLEDSILTSNSNEEALFIGTNPDLFQWNYFNTEYEAKMITPTLESGENACLSWLATKETFFLTFVEVFVVHVESVTTGKVVWSAIPAYELILKCFLPLLRSAVWWDGVASRKTGQGQGWVTSLPAYMRVKRSALAVLTNKDLINEFVQITFECTNAYSLLSVDSCVEHLNLWFSTIAYSSTAKEGISNHNQNSRNTPSASNLDGTSIGLPESFDFDLYWYGISTLLESELFQVLLKVLSLLYNTFHLFKGQKRVKIVSQLMNQFFFRLFLHWSTEVRTYFQLTLVYKVIQSDRRFLPCFTDEEVINKYGQEKMNPIKPISQRRSSFDGTLPSEKDGSGTPSSIQFGESSVERRMAIFDESNKSDNEQLLIDIMHCSKVDSYIRMCLQHDETIPAENRVYIESSLKQYAHLLKQCYRGAGKDSSESLQLLAHRMVYSDSNPYL